MLRNFLPLLSTKGQERKREITHDNLLPERGNPLSETVSYKIGVTIYEVSTNCDGSELLYDKMKRLIKAESVKTPADKKAVLSKYAANNGFTDPSFFIDDGVSGVTFDRPNFNRIIAEIEAGNVATVIVFRLGVLCRLQNFTGFSSGFMRTI